MSLKQKPEEIFNSIDYKPEKKHWMDTTVDFQKRGTYNYAAVPASLEYTGQPNARKWQPYEDDWKLPENWKEIILEGFRLRISADL